MASYLLQISGAGQVVPSLSCTRARLPHAIISQCPCGLLLAQYHEAVITSPMPTSLARVEIGRILFLVLGKQYPVEDTLITGSGGVNGPGGW